MPRTARTLLLALTVSAVLSPAAEASECPADARASDVRIQLWKERGCSGPWIEVPFGEDGDRPDFRRFRHSDGEEYDVDDNRESAAVAPGTCVRFFTGAGYGGHATGLRCAPRGDDLGLSLPEGISSMRACPSSEPSLCRRRTRRIGGQTRGRVFVERFAFDRPGAYPEACTGRALPGIRLLAQLIRERWRTGSTRLGYACVESGGGTVDVHGEGRAIDWALNARSPHDRAIGNAIVGWLLADDRFGNRHARARRMGVQEIAWNGRRWIAPRWQAGMRPIRSGDRRRRWIHIALTRSGARMQTSYWR